MTVKPVKICYSHIGGKLGALLLDSFASNAWIKKEKETDKHYYITEKGLKEFDKLGINIELIKDEKI